jgi:hypothetical protein
MWAVFGGLGTLDRGAGRRAGGGFANGLTGFGTGLTALPFWLQVVAR